MSSGDGSFKSTAPAASNTMDTAEEVYWIKPMLPTILGDLQELPVPGTDLIFASVRAKINFFTHGVD